VNGRVPGKFFNLKEIAAKALVKQPSKTKEGKTAHSGDVQVTTSDSGKPVDPPTERGCAIQ
jgi:hypothetical protein